MKKATIFLTLILVFTLSACSSSNQEVKNPTDSNPAATESAEIPTAETSTPPQDDTDTEIPAPYSELLDTYATALGEKWNSSVLMEKGLNPMVADLYNGAPLNNIGYAIMDLDGNGIEELVIGTTASVTDDFYGKLIFDLYTLEPDGFRIQVLSSTVRNCYYYAGGQLFVDLGSSSADDYTNATMYYGGKGLTDTNTVTHPGDYVQMELTPISQWTGSTAGGLPVG